MNEVQQAVGGRRERRRLEHRRRILDAASTIMSRKGMADATMAEIADGADVALGSLYNHFSSKHELSIAVVDAEIASLAEMIDVQTAAFADPAMVFAFGCRTVMEHATANDRWRQLLDSPGVIAEAFFRGFGPYAMRDLRRAVDAGRLRTSEVELTWRLTTWAIIGASSAVCRGDAGPAALDGAVVAILGIAGIDESEARRIAASLPLPSAPRGSS